MDEILNEFLIETSESLDVVSGQLVLFERDPSDPRIIGSIFRCLHTIKGTCGFLGLTRLQRLTHAAEALIVCLRDGEPATRDRVSLILRSFDQIRALIAEIEQLGADPPGDDEDLIARLEAGALSEAALTSSVGMAPRQTAEENLTDTAPRDASSSSGSPLSGQGPSVRVAVGALERMMTLVSELVLARNQVMEAARGRQYEPIAAILQRLSSITSDLQDGVMRARMQPIRRVFANLPRVVRALSMELGKKIDLVTLGAETELDRQLIESIRDPLTQLIRNAADHGIEPPEERRAAGKREIGVIRILASHDAGHISIELSDDGRGMDIERIRAKAGEMGLADADTLAKMTSDEVCRFIFAPGFSTSAASSNVSGRGVGMDVVRANIESIGGEISLSTVAGQGVSFKLKIPLTLAIAPALIVRVADHRFALPQHAVVEAVSAGGANENKLHTVQGALLLRLRDRVIPIVDLSRMLRLQPQDLDAEHFVVVMRVGSSPFGVMVEQVSDAQEIVIKPLGPSLAHLSCFSGNTILGDGSVALLLDPARLAESVGIDSSSRYMTEALDDDIAPLRASTRFILFKTGRGVRKALPLSLITRIENVPRRRIVCADGSLTMQFQDKLMPLVQLDDKLEDFEGERPVLIIGVGAEPMGILASSIVDVIEERLEIQIAGSTPGVIGCVNLQGEPTEVLDAAHYMRIARPNAFSRGHARRFKVLLVDDKQFFRDMLAPILAAAGYDVFTAAGGREALLLLSKKSNFDAVLTDIDMPEMDGYELARTIKRDTRHANVPILALDAYASNAVRSAAAAAGMRSACGKFDRASLLSWLAEVLDATAFEANSVEARQKSEAQA